MPIYEYRCTNCNNVFDIFHEVGGTPGPCTNCGGTLRRIFTSVGLVFKGSGFHATDYRKRGSSDAGPVKEPSAKESSGKESSGKESSGKESSSTNGKSAEASAKSDA